MEVVSQENETSVWLRFNQKATKVSFVFTAQRRGEQ